VADEPKLHLRYFTASGDEKVVLKFEYAPSCEYAPCAEVLGKGKLLTAALRPCSWRSSPRKYSETDLGANRA